MRNFGRSNPYAKLKVWIKSVFDEHEGRFGYRRIRDELRNHGHKVNHKKVQRIMKELGLKCLVRMKKYRPYKVTVGKIALNILDRISKLKKQMRNRLRILQSLIQMKKTAKIFDNTVEQIHYFNGICDLSYVNYDDDANGWSAFESNTPVWGDTYSIPFSEMAQLKTPVLNCRSIRERCTSTN